MVQVAVMERKGAALAHTTKLELDLRESPRRAPLHDVPALELDPLPHLVQLVAKHVTKHKRRDTGDAGQHRHDGAQNLVRGMVERGPNYGAEKQVPNKTNLAS